MSAFLDQVLDGAIVISDRFEVVSWNKAASWMFGYRNDEVIGHSVKVLLPEPYYSQENTAFSTFLAARLPKILGARNEIIGRRKNGHPFGVGLGVSSFFDMQSRYFVGFVKDLDSARRQNGAEPWQTAGLRSITNALPAAIAYVDQDLKYHFCNNTYEKWVGKSQRDILGYTVPTVVGASYFEMIRPHIERALRGEAVEYELERPCSDKARHVIINLIPNFSAGMPKGFVVLITDITENFSIRAELQAAKEAADASNKAKSAFLANMSHEIRTPLGAVLGFSELLANSGLKVTERAHFIAAIKRNGELLSGIISDILDLSKIEAGKIETDAQLTSVHEVLEGVTALLSLRAKEKGLSFYVYSQGTIPSVIRTDKQKLRQILLNIIGNAIKFTHRGSVEVKIMTVDCGQGGLRLSFVVTDTGPGIEGAAAKRLFEPFFQADTSSKRNHGGTGLGLVLSKRLAQVLGGDVVLTASTPGSGSTFTITIDPGDAARGPFEVYQGSLAPGRGPVPPSELARLDGLRILLVEDCADNQILLRRILTSAGALIDLADNGRRALVLARRHRYDVILMDVQMPIMDGYETTATLRKEGIMVPILALTAHAMSDERQRCLLVGFDDHLSKPIDRGALLSRLAKIPRLH